VDARDATDDVLARIVTVSELCGVCLSLVLVEADPVVLRRRLLQRCTMEHSWHRLVPQGVVDSEALQKGLFAYEKVLEAWRGRAATICAVQNNVDGEARLGAAIELAIRRAQTCG
jgi:hypothetical protein